MKSFILVTGILAILSVQLRAQFESDVIKTSKGELEMFFIGHGSLMFKFNDLVIHIDPTMREADYSNLPDADLILVTHQHGDHLDMTAIRHILAGNTMVVMTQTCLEQLEDFNALTMDNGDDGTILGLELEALPAYNIKHLRSSGKAYHPKGEGNAYIIEFGDTRVLIGGDTENTPELKAAEEVDIAFLPMNLPYTMTPEMVADAARAIQPGILYPYHYGETDPEKLVKLLKGNKGIEVRIRNLQ